MNLKLENNLLERCESSSRSQETPAAIPININREFFLEIDSICQIIGTECRLH